MIVLGRRHLFRGLLLSGLGLLFASIWLSRPPDLSPLSDLSRILQADDGQILQLRLNSAGKWREAIVLSEIDPNLISTLIAFEDQRFYDHIGVDFRALARAGLTFIREQRVVSGGSTLTMQLARLLDPDLRSGGLISKFRQIAFAIKLDWHLTKSEILSAYFTLAPYGGNIEGVMAASAAWFQRPPSALTPSQIGLLVALPQNPEQRRPDRFHGRAIAAKNHVLTTVAPILGFSAQDLQDYVSEDLPLELVRPNSNAQHAFDRLMGDGDEVNLSQTSLRAEWQVTLGRLVEGEIGVYPAPINAAAMVVERRTGLVRAYHGSSSYLDQERKGGNNFLRSIRSPGSLLKPLIYGLAIEEGLIAPDHVFVDQRLQVAAYAPGNFDGQFSGAISLADALVSSRNIPAIKTFQQLGSARVARLIEQVIGRQNSQSLGLGLSLAVGGFSMNAEEIVTLYLALSDPGDAAGLQFWVGEEASTQPAEALISPDTAQTLMSLMAVRRSDGRGYRVAKTGTSQNRQDAHAVLITQDHLIYTWLGTPDNEATQSLTGAASALPLAERIQAALNLAPPFVAQSRMGVTVNLNPTTSCTQLILIPEDGDWIRTQDLSLFVDLSDPEADLYLNGYAVDRREQVLTLPTSGAHRLSASSGDCRQTIEVFVDTASGAIN